MTQTVSTQVQASVKTPEREYRWAEVSPETWIRIAVLTGLFVLFFADDLWGILHRWTSDSTWSHGFLIPAFSLYFLHRKKDHILSQSFSPNWTVGLILFVLCLVAYPVNIVQFKFAYGRAVLMVMTLGAMVFFLGGLKLIKYTWLPVVYLFFAVPLPERLYAQITIPLRKMAAEASVIVLNFIPDLQATASGVVIDVLYKGKVLEPALDVAEACSGMRLLMAFVALGVAMAYLHDRPVWQRLVLLASTVPIALLCNVVRVTITGLIYILWDPKYAQGIYHDTLGLLMLPLAFGLYGLMAWLMSSIYEDVPDQTQPELIIRRSGSPSTPKEDGRNE
jgi:exosortase